MDVCSPEEAGSSAEAIAMSFLASARRKFVYVDLEPFLNLKVTFLTSRPFALTSPRSPQCTARTLSLQLPSRLIGRNKMRLLVTTSTQAANSAVHQAAVSCSATDSGLRAGIAKSMD